MLVLSFLSSKHQLVIILLFLISVQNKTIHMPIHHHPLILHKTHVHKLKYSHLVNIFICDDLNTDFYHIKLNGISSPKEFIHTQMLDFTKKEGISLMNTGMGFVLHQASLCIFTSEWICVSFETQFFRLKFPYNHDSTLCRNFSRSWGNADER